MNPERRKQYDELVKKLMAQPEPSNEQKEKNKKKWALAHRIFANHNLGS